MVEYGSFNSVDLIVRSLALTGVFLLLTYFFRDKVVIEGFVGYVIVLGLLVPINVYLNSGGGQNIPGLEALELREMALTVLLFNIVMGVILNKKLPALSISSIWALLAFMIVFSAASACVSLVPEIHPLPTTSLD